MGETGRRSRHTVSRVNGEWRAQVTDATLTILATAAAPTIAATAAFIVSIVNSIKANKIHVLVNSNLTAVKEDLESARAEIKALREELSGEDHP